MKLAGRRVLVVGASEGLGRAVARRLALGGAEVGLVARRRGLLEALAAEIRAGGGEARVLVADTREDAEVEKAHASFAARGPVDGLVFMAGISHVTLPGAPVTAEAREVLETNYLGFLRWLDRVLPGMKSRGEGLVAAATALCAYRGIPCGEAYAASKGALKNHLEALALDLPPYGIEVVQVMPGFVDTPMSRRNNFTQPFMIPAAQGAEMVFRALERGSGRIELGAGMSWTMRVLRLLPDALYGRVFAGFAARRRETERLLEALPPMVCPEHGDPLEFDRYADFECPACGAAAADPPGGRGTSQARFARDHLDLIEARDALGEADRKMTAAYRLYSITYPVTAYLAMRRVWKGELAPLVDFYAARLAEAAADGRPALDVATGDGSLLALALRKVPGDHPDLLCVDLSRDMLGKASRRLGAREPVLFLRADIGRLCLPDRSFRRILCFGGVHVFTDPEGALARMAELLEDGGEVSGSILTRPPDEAGRRWSDRFIAWGSLSNSMTEEELEALFASAGLELAAREWNGAMLLFRARKAGGG